MKHEGTFIKSQVINNIVEITLKFSTEIDMSKLYHNKRIILDDSPINW